MTRSLLEYTDCFQDTPVFLSSGFDLSIDDCINQGTPSFKDYGQCDRFNETLESGWWMRHRTSYAARQLFAAERGLGWSFATWKLYDDDSVGVIDTPAKLLSLQDVAEAGLFPNLDKDIPAQSACLNPPENDFMMGDKTLAPTVGPPPDCGNGWWNYTTEKCKSASASLIFASSNRQPCVCETFSHAHFLRFNRRLLDSSSTPDDVTYGTVPRV
jgi:hypothetical protein